MFYIKLQVNCRVIDPLIAWTIAQLLGTHLYVKIEAASNTVRGANKKKDESNMHPLLAEIFQTFITERG